MDWSEILAAVTTAWGAWGEMRARKAKKEAKRLASDLDRIRIEAGTKRE